MKRLTAFLLIAALLCPAAERGELFQQIDEIVSELGRITGLENLRKVQYDTINKEQLRQFLEDRIREEVKPEEIRSEELTLKKFGLIPEDFDLKQATIDLFTEQAAAFYDFRKKKLFVLDWTHSTLQEAALVHELAHALADQHFNLEKFIDRGSQSDDGSLARLAVMEGQATWLMSEYFVRRTGISLKGSQGLVDSMSKMVGGTTGQFPVFDQAPLYIRESLLFPYTSGMKFQHDVFERMGQKAFAEVFRRPPASTQQILHPDTYFVGSQGKPPRLPELTSERSYRKLTEGTVGEFDHAILLRQYTGEDATRSLAPRWRAGAYRLLENKKETRTVLSYASVWQRPEDARAFFDLYRKILRGKWKTMEITEDTSGRLAGVGDDGYFLVRLAGAGVSSLEGLRQPEEARQRPLR